MTPADDRRLGRIYRVDVEVAIADDNVRDIARRMRERRVGALVVVDEGRRPVGIVTDRDLALRVLGEGRDASATRLADVMTKAPVVIAEDASIDAALGILGLQPRRFRRLPVVDAEGRLVGIFTVDDALMRIAADLAAIERVIRGETPFIVDGVTRDDIERSRLASNRLKGSRT